MRAPDPMYGLGVRNAYRRPRDIPYSPHVAYANSGWEGMDDWLGGDLTAEIDAPSFR
ncbi:hypothetical protein ACVIGB_000951 [Bradyrhizobium sp. USDA 4341]